MVIYQDLTNHDEMFSNIYKIWEIAGGLRLEVEGKMVSRTQGNTDDSLFGGNASAESPEGKGPKSTVITGGDIIMNHHLQGTSLTKGAYKKHVKGDMNPITGFMTGAAEQIEPILANLKNHQFSVGENMHPDGMVAMLDHREDGVISILTFVKDGLEMGKCFHLELSPVIISGCCLSSTHQD
ncbi:translationally-controlled tumor protein-like [Myotis daubentonii]|uniref:translationally-controlled tumor protein-like n=1 Tax=Myotis daubentonii TaxID=98922 RepID=UPI0028737BB2|nr:translationally-controlled tumor protein-like [Myotis daubentonii]